ncbi:hypothetical protein [Sphingomonas sp. STIS6.2]|uniref:hypothetical protein n=1 Tax=Sphingomonas sp. STIS6.2 TaxID=1379700 RepID=UPI0004DB6F81|nr:hypothetical protein [Sphingomonas sp. STIS6.2]
MNDSWITEATEPDHLILAWQAPDECKDRTRFAVGMLTCREGEVRLRYFGDGDEFQRLNPGKTYSQMVDYGYAGYPGFSTDTAMHSSGVIEAFMRRLPPRTRSDFAAYEQHLRVRSGTELSDFALLGLSEAYLPSDGFSVVDPLDPNVDRRQLLIEVAGYRYYAAKATRSLPTVGDKVEIVAEDDNKFDPRAVAVVFKGDKIGNINRLQVETFRTWAAQGRLEANVTRLNGRAARPRLFVFVRVSLPV